MSAGVLAFAESLGPAQALADELGLTCNEVELRRFPDGESLVRVPACPEIALLYRSLDDPNAKLVELLLAAAALRDGGTRSVVLIAPYLSYMRQDMAFRPGEAVSQRVVGGLIAEHFNGLVTIDPHLHRIRSLGEAVPGIPALSLSAAPALAAAIDPATMPVLVGPDSESRPWVEAIAAPLGLTVLVGEKDRRGDREVTIRIPGVETVAGKTAIIVDDVISSGETAIVAAGQLLAAGARNVEMLATHCLAGPGDLTRMQSAGIASIRTTLSVAGATASIPIAGLIAGAIRAQRWAS